MISVASITFVIAGFLVLASVVQPAAERLHLPYTVLLAILGVALGGVSSFLLYTPLTNAFSTISSGLSSICRLTRRFSWWCFCRCCCFMQR